MSWPTPLSFERTKAVPVLVHHQSLAQCPAHSRSSLVYTEWKDEWMASIAFLHLMNWTHFTLGQSGNMLRRAKPPFASLAVSCYAHSIFSAWFQISDHFLLSTTKQEMHQWLEVLFKRTRQFPEGLYLKAPVKLLTTDFFAFSRTGQVAKRKTPSHISRELPFTGIYTF